MSTATPLMPKATAVWLVANTSLSFDQTVAKASGMAADSTMPSPSGTGRALPSWTAQYSA